MQSSASRAASASVSCQSLTIPHVNDEVAVRAALTEAAPDSDPEYNVLVAHVGLDGLGHVGGSEAGSLTLSRGDPGSGGRLRLHRPRARPPAPVSGRARQRGPYAGSLERLSWQDVAQTTLRACWRSTSPRASPALGFVQTPHEIPVRPHISLPAIDASGVGDLEGAIVAAAATLGRLGSCADGPIGRPQRHFGGMERCGTAAASPPPSPTACTSSCCRRSSVRSRWR